MRQPQLNIRLCSTLLVGACLTVLAGCENTLVFGESTGFNLGIEADAAKAVPFEANAGLRRQVVGLVPPLGRDENGRPNTEATNLVGTIRIAQTTGSTGPFDTQVTVASGYATGPAAVALVNGTTENPKNANQAEAAVKAVVNATNTVRVSDDPAARTATVKLLSFVNGSDANLTTYLALAKAQGISLTGVDAASQAAIAIGDGSNATKNIAIAKALKLI